MIVPTQLDFHNSLKLIVVCLMSGGLGFIDVADPFNPKLITIKLTIVNEIG